LNGPGGTLATPVAGAWKDVLRIIYFGMDHTIVDANSGATTQNCSSNVRQSLLNNYGAIFKGGCTTGTCPNGLQHAFRRDDQSGTTDTFIKLTGAYAFQGGSVAAQTGLGADDGSTAHNFVHTKSPFCNGRELEDRDPVRRACFTPACTTNADCQGNLADGTPVVCKSGKCFGDAREESVCGPDGKLGVVLPILASPEPDALPATGNTDNLAEVPTTDVLYTMPPCDNSGAARLLKCAVYTDYRTQAVVFQCANRALEDGRNVAGKAFTPTTPAGKACLCNGDPGQCLTVQAPTDHRAWNLYVRRAADGQIINNAPPNTPTGKNPAAAQILTTADPLNKDGDQVAGLGTQGYPVHALPATVAGAAVNNPFPAGYQLERFYPVINAYFRLLGSPFKPSSNRCSTFTDTTTACAADADCGTAAQSEGSRCLFDSTATGVASGIGSGPAHCSKPNSDTRTIGCLASLGACSIGYSGKESATSNPTAVFSAQIVNDIPLTDPNILSNTYPIARPLFISSLKGFDGCNAGIDSCTRIGAAGTPDRILERKFAGETTTSGGTAAAGCYNDLARVNNAATRASFVPGAFHTGKDATTDHMDCVDFDETTCNSVAECALDADCTTATGTHSCVATKCQCTADADCPGGRTCVSGSCTYVSNRNACCGDGVVSAVPGSPSGTVEQCDPPDGVTCDSKCQLITP
jgi:hypothetical protein